MFFNIIDKNDRVINTISSDLSFVIEWCKENSYRYEEINIENDKETTIADLKQENKLLKAQVQAASDRSDFLEDCIAEMATLVYNSEETT